MEAELLKQILKELKSVKQSLKEHNEVKTLGYKEVSDIMHVNSDRSGDFLKKYGFRCGHWAIEQGKLKSLLRNSKGDLLK